MVAYKVFNKDWTCKGFQYEVGKTYSIKEDPILCERGFHACENLADCFDYYSFDPENKVAEVVISGKIVYDENKQKLATNKIKIKKALTWEEVLRLANSGDRNSGHSNSGDRNSGDRNSGDRNSGHSNSGDRNSGHSNSGDRNSGDRNSGHRNSGNWNSGNWNSGNWNSGNWNSGDSNSGDGNSGDGNSGHSNSGHRNSGHSNSGHSNSGHSNSGNWNSGHSNSGVLNTNSPDKMRVFNKWIKPDKYKNIKFPNYFIFDMTVFIGHDVATQPEKEKYKKEFETIGGYLKTLSYKEAWKLSWDKADIEDKKKTLKIPGFDNDLFFEISGINVKEELK